MPPRRSILSVPGHMENMHAKALGSQADAVLFDLEDSVPLALKEKARQQVIRTLAAAGGATPQLSFRINALDTPFGYRDLLEVVEAAGDRLATVVIPMVDHPGDVHFADRLLEGIGLARGKALPIGIEASIETARGLEQVSDIARASRRLRALVFGVADYTASIGARLVSLSGHGESEEAIYPGHRWHFALSRVVMAAKAGGLMAVDAPYGYFKDAAGLEKAARMASALGCDGKWAIHPTQIEIINRVFSPSAEDIERAGKILAAAEAASADGRGAVAVEGRMVDQATVGLARRVWDQARALNLIDPPAGEE
jgi:citrate lyase subunit beta/citryl-CoA lyase/malyl-CoA/(S)-citramalyl-CoA lyase